MCLDAVEGVEQAGNVAVGLFCAPALARVPVNLVKPQRCGLLDANGHFLSPTIINKVPLDAPVYTEEVFGPVLTIVEADTYEEAIKIVNSSEFGNGAAIFTNDGGMARRFTLDVQAGMVGVNVPIPTPVAYYSFGGWKDSLLGDTHIHGPEGVKFYTRGKAITSRWPSEATYEATMSFQRED